MQDLWADFAGEAPPTEEAGRGGRVRHRRLTEQAAVMALRSWLLQEYMLPYGASLGATRIFKRCYWIDGLGHARVPSQPVPIRDQAEAEPTGKRGRRKSGDQVPVVPPALQPVTMLARQLARVDRPISLQGLLLDERHGQRKGENARQARSKTETGATLALPKESGLLPACWQELAPSLLAALEQSAAVFLLNPLSDGLFRYTDLLPLYQRAAPTELFLWLPHKHIETRLLPRLRTAEGAAALTNLLRGDRWKGRLAKEAEDTQGIIHGLVELLAESMRPHFLTVQQLTFPVRRGPALVEATPYSLLFATRRQDSLCSLNDAICLRERALLKESHHGVLNEEWFTAQREEQAVARLQALAQETRSLGRAQRVRRWPDLRQQLLLAHFGQNLLRDYDHIISSLLEHGDVRCEWRKRSQDTGATSVPGHDDLLLWS